MWSAIAINDQQLKEKIYILMDTDGGPQADDGGEQGLINDGRLMMLFTRKTRRGTEARKRTLWVNGNCHQLDSN